VIRIREEIASIYATFGERLKKTYPEQANQWQLATVLSARTKVENFYMPGNFSYERGRFSLGFLTEEENLAQAIDQEFYARYKNEFIDIYQNRESYLAPVIRIRTRDGERQYIRYPPFIRTCAYFTGKMPGKGQSAEATAEIPTSYDTGKCL
jgi:hypothetical protein